MEKSYIYIVKNKITGQFYIGSQCSGKILGKNYFTSACGKNNKYLPKDFKEHTQNYDYWKIASFDNPEECVKEEQKLIKDNFSNNLILNESYHIGNIFSNIIYRTPEEKIIKKQKEKQRKKEWYIKNNQEEKQKRKQYYEENKESFREYHFNNRDKILKRQKEHYIKNREKLIQHSKDYQKNHREEVLKRKKEYHEKNKIYEKEYRKKYVEEHKDEIKTKKKKYELIISYIKKQPEQYEKYKNLPKKEKMNFRENFYKFNIMKK